MIELKMKKLIKNVLEIVFMTMLYVVMDRVDGITKYIIVLLASMFFLFCGRKKKLRVETVLCVLTPPLIYILNGSFSTLVASNSQIQTIKTILYTVVPMVFSFSLYSFYGTKMHHIIDIQFYASVVGFIFFCGPITLKYLFWESTYAFVFGIFTLYYAYQKKWILCVMAFLFMIFANKRIVLLAVAATLILMGALKFFRNNEKLVCGFWISVIGMIYTYLYLIYSGILDEFCWGANINTNGRVKMYARMVEEAEFSIKYLGKGLGHVEQLLSYWNVKQFANLHNDLLKIYVELGFVGLLLYLVSFFVIFYYINRFGKKEQMTFFVVLWTYVVILFSTDNVSIYIMFLIPLYTVLFATLSMEEKEK